MAALLTVAAPAAAQPAWAHQVPGFQSNGAITVKSLAGGFYGGTENPIGAVAKANQSAVTQPPTIIVQATTSALPFNYKDDCYILMPPTGAGYTQDTLPRLGAGKIDSSSGKFTGLLAFGPPGSGYPAPASAALLGAMLGLSPTTSAVTTAFCNSDAACAYGASQYSGSNPAIVAVAQLTIKSYARCYP
jgi:hypothetical protein